MIKNDGFRVLLYHKFIYRKAFRVDEVADKMGIPPTTFYKYLQGQMNFPVDLVAKLYSATGDIEFLNFILNDTPHMLAPRKAAGAGKSLTDEALDTAAATGRLISEVQKAAGEVSINDIERRKLNRQIDEAEKDLEELRKTVNES